jgi:hypothetical protein
MGRVSIYLYTLVALLLLLGAPMSAQPAAEEEMDSLSSGAVQETPREAQVEFLLPEGPIEVGVPFTLRMRVLVPGDFEGIKITPDPAGKAYLLGEDFRKIGDNEFAAAYRVRKAGDHEFKLQLDGIVAGSEEPIRLETPSLKLKVPPPIHEASTSFRGFTDVRSIPFDYTWRNVILTIVGILAVVLLVVSGFLIARFLQRRAAILPPTFVRAPIEEALENVKLLSSLEVFLISGTDAHYTALSMALRRYLERQFGVPAVEMTEDEVIDFVRRNLDTAQQAAALNQVFSRSSLAKFARQPISREVAAEDCDASLKFLQREQQRLEALEAARRARESQSERSAA